VYVGFVTEDYEYSLGANDIVAAFTEARYVTDKVEAALAEHVLKRDAIEEHTITVEAQEAARRSGTVTYMPGPISPIYVAARPAEVECLAVGYVLQVNEDGTLYRTDAELIDMGDHAWRWEWTDPKVLAI
jgi:hypothetical protein